MKKTKSSLPPKGGPTKEDRKIKEYCDKFTTDIPKTREDFLMESFIIKEALRVKFEELFHRITCCKVYGDVEKAAHGLRRCKQKELKAKFCKVLDAFLSACALIAKIEEEFNKTKLTKG